MQRRRWIITIVPTLALLASIGIGLDIFSQDVSHAQASSPQPQAAVGAAFTYQGRLTDAQGAPLTGTYDFEFELYDGRGSGASQVGSTITVNDKQVDDGLFTVELDFGTNVFAGDPRWLEIYVRPGSSTSGYAQLLPRQ